MKRITIALLSVILLGGLFCQAAVAKTIKLRLAHEVPPQSSLGVALENYAKKITEESQGKVQITVYGGGSLNKGEEFYDAVAQGVADISYGTFGNAEEHFSLENGIGLPGLGWSKGFPAVIPQRLKVLDALREKYPQIEANRKEVVVLFDITLSPLVFDSPKKRVRVPEDIKGLQVAATGWIVDYVRVLGAAPVAISAMDRYMAADRGTIDGSLDIWGGIFALKLYEANKFYLEGVEFGDSPAALIMNRKKYESLPPDIKQLFQDNKAYGIEQLTWAFDSFAELGKKKAVEAGGEIVVATPEEAKAWREASLPFHDIWVKQIEDRGLPGRQYLEDMKALIQKYN